MPGRVLKTDKPLRFLIHIMYGIPPRCLMRRTQRPRWHFSALSIILTLVQWFSYSYEMHVAKTYWRSGSKGKPEMPVETLLLLVTLFLSAAFSCTLFMVYFYRPDHNFEHEGMEHVLPYFEFAPLGRQEIILISSKHWRIANTYLVLGFGSLVFLWYCAFELNIFFDFTGIHNFVDEISTYQRLLYYTAIGIIYWGMFGVVVACCLFYIICQDMVQHIDFTKRLIIEDARDFHTAKRYHECLLTYTDEVMGSIKWWFVIHNIFFVFITLSTVVEWIVAFTSKTDAHNMFYLLLSQFAGSLLVAFKYAFPFLAASRVTRKFEKMYKHINRQCHPRDFPDIDAFMSYCTRCKAGFTIFGVKVTAQLALFALISCFVGFFKLYKSIST